MDSLGTHLTKRSATTLENSENKKTKSDAQAVKDILKILFSTFNCKTTYSNLTLDHLKLVTEINLGKNRLKRFKLVLKEHREELKSIKFPDVDLRLKQDAEIDIENAEKTIEDTPILKGRTTLKDSEEKLERDLLFLIQVEAFARNYLRCSIMRIIEMANKINFSYSDKFFKSAQELITISDQSRIIDGVQIFDQILCTQSGQKYIDPGTIFDEINSTEATAGIPYRVLEIKQHPLLFDDIFSNENVEELAFVQSLKKHFTIQDVRRDGHCLVRSVLKALGTEDTIQEVFNTRASIANILAERLEEDPDQSILFFSETFSNKLESISNRSTRKEYIEKELQKLRTQNQWLGNESLPILAKIAKRPIYVYDRHDGALRERLNDQIELPIPVDLKCYGKDEFSTPPIYLYYERSCHYQLMIPLEKNQAS